MLDLIYLYYHILDLIGSETTVIPYLIRNRSHPVTRVRRGDPFTPSSQKTWEVGLRSENLGENPRGYFPIVLCRLCMSTLRLVPLPYPFHETRGGTTTSKPVP